MADTKVSALGAFTPAAEDLLYGVDDPSGTPASGKFTVADLFSVLNAYIDVSDVVSFRNGTTGQGIYLYGSYTDASNYERGAVAWNGTTFDIGTYKAGSGGNRAVRFFQGGSVAFNCAGDGQIYYSYVPIPSSDQGVTFGTSTRRWNGVYVNSMFIDVGYTVATLPGSPRTGQQCRVTDASTPAVGSTVAGGGAAAALVWYNGAAWTVIGV